MVKVGLSSLNQWQNKQIFILRSRYHAFVDLDIDPLLNIRTGQFLAPFGLEGQEVIAFNPAIERSIATRRLNTVNMFRDIGIQANGSRGLFNYSFALVNGTGANTTAKINPKDLLG